MKKLFYTTALALLTSTALFSQGTIKLGVTGGLYNVNADVELSALGFDLLDLDAVNQTGFYIGAIAASAASEKFHVQPELTYASAGDLSFVYLPIMAKYYVASGFYIQAGPQFNYSSNLDEIKNTIRDIDGVLGTNSNLDDVLNTLGVDIGFGAGYDINENFSVQARYAFALTDRYSGPLGGSLDVTEGTLNIGIAYFFDL